MSRKKFYYDLVAQVWSDGEDGEGVHYAVGQDFDETNPEQPVSAYGTVDTVEEAVNIVEREICGLLHNG